MPTNTLISKIDGMLIQDRNAIHDISTNLNDNNCSTFTIRIGDPSSKHTKTETVYLPPQVMMKSYAGALIYKGVIAGGATSPGTSIPASEKGNLYKVSAAGYIATVKCEIGDMIICNTTTSTASATPEKFDFIQTNIDPTIYSLKGHSHTVSIADVCTGESGAFTPAGTISVSVTGDTTSFTGSYTPEGTITGTYSTVSSAHSHSFTGTTATVSVEYTKITGIDNSLGAVTVPSHNYTPEGTISVVLTSGGASATVGGTIVQEGHTHAFTGDLATYTGSYTPAGTISDITVTTTLSSTSFDYLSDVSTRYTSTPTGSFITSYTYDAATEAITFVNASVYYDRCYTTYSTTNSGNLLTNVTAHGDAPTFYGKQETISVSGTPSGTIDKVQPLIYNNVTVEYTKVLGIESQTFTGTAATLDHTAVNLSHSHSLASTTDTASGTYTPAGTIDSQTVTVTGDITATFTGTTATITVSGTPLIKSATGTFYGNAVAAHSHSMTFTTISAADPQ